MIDAKFTELYKLIIEEYLGKKDYTEEEINTIRKGMIDSKKISDWEFTKVNIPKSIEGFAKGNGEGVFALVMEKTFDDNLSACIIMNDVTYYRNEFMYGQVHLIQKRGEYDRPVIMCDGDNVLNLHGNKSLPFCGDIDMRKMHCNAMSYLELPMEGEHTLDDHLTVVSTYYPADIQCKLDEMRPMVNEVMKLISFGNMSCHYIPYIMPVKPHNKTIKTAQVISECMLMDLVDIVVSNNDKIREELVKRDVDTDRCIELAKELFVKMVTVPYIGN